MPLLLNSFKATAFVSTLTQVPLGFRSRIPVCVSSQSAQVLARPAVARQQPCAGYGVVGAAFRSRIPVREKRSCLRRPGGGPVKTLPLKGVAKKGTGCPVKGVMPTRPVSRYSVSGQVKSTATASRPVPKGAVRPVNPPRTTQKYNVGGRVVKAAVKAKVETKGKPKVPAKVEAKAAAAAPRVTKAAVKTKVESKGKPKVPAKVEAKAKVTAPPVAKKTVVRPVKSLRATTKYSASGRVVKSSSSDKTAPPALVKKQGVVRPQATQKPTVPVKTAAKPTTVPSTPVPKKTGSTRPAKTPRVVYTVSGKVCPVKPPVKAPQTPPSSKTKVVVPQSATQPEPVVLQTAQPSAATLPTSQKSRLPVPVKSSRVKRTMNVWPIRFRLLSLLPGKRQEAVGSRIPHPTWKTRPKFSELGAVRKQERTRARMAERAKRPQFETPKHRIYEQCYTPLIDPDRLLGIIPPAVNTRADRVRRIIPRNMFRSESRWHHVPGTPTPVSRECSVSADGSIYFSLSNNDSVGSASSSDDGTFYSLDESSVFEPSCYSLGEGVFVELH